VTILQEKLKFAHRWGRARFLTPGVGTPARACSTDPVFCGPGWRITHSDTYVCIKKPP